MKKIKLLSILSTGLAIAAVTGSVMASHPAAVSAAAPGQQPAAHQYDHKKQFVNQELLTLLKTDADTLRKELKAGRSLADMAAANGVGKQQVIDLLVKQATQRMEQGVKAGRLTQAEADQKKAKLQEWITKRVEQKGFPRGGHHQYGKGKGLQDAAAVLGMEKKDLLIQLKAGKSLAEIAQTRGISKDQLIAKLLEKKKEQLTRIVEHKWQQHD